MLRSIRRLIQYTGLIIKFGLATLVVAALSFVYMVVQTANELPRYDHLKSYDPSVMSRIHADDGVLIAEFARERRLFVPISAIPDVVKNAFLATEDHRFYSHIGIDPIGIIRAAVTNVANYGSNKRLVGASTITQQVAKNFLLSSEVSLKRKMTEAILAYRLEQALSKDQILELYLNGIYLGAGSYGVGAAALTYFDKALYELDVSEAAFLAALPRSPSNYHPVKFPERALNRRNWVLNRLLVEKFIDEQEYAKSVATDFKVVMRPFGVQAQADAYFAEEVRRRLVDKFGSTRLYDGGLSVRSSLDTRLQRIAQWSLRKSIATHEQGKGYRGHLGTTQPEQKILDALYDAEVPVDLAPWRVAVVNEVSNDGAQIAVRIDERLSANGKPAIKRGYIAHADVVWAVKPDDDWVALRVAALENQIREQAIADGQDPDHPFFELPARPLLPEETINVTPETAQTSHVLKRGDVIIVRPVNDADPFSQEVPDRWILAQLPELQGAMMALDPHTGRVRAMVGGFSFAASSFNRAVQAKRQPGSAFKPFVYLTALNNGLTPSTVLSDSPLVIDQGEEWGYWRPKNYSGRFLGSGTLRLGIERSRNVMTVRLTQQVGTRKILETAQKFGIGEDWNPIPSIALGAGEATLLDLAVAYGSIANGGKKIEAGFIDHVQDKFGKTIFRADQRECEPCEYAVYDPDAGLPVFSDLRPRLIDEASAYQITSMMEGVVQNGTGRALKDVGKPIAGKTGTTNQEKDSWFIGFTPDLVVGAYFGYDIPKPMGQSGTGGGLSAPAVRDFFTLALADKPAVPFRVPQGIRFFRIRADNGHLAQSHDTNVILEAFKSGEFPPTGKRIETALVDDVDTPDDNSGSLLSVRDVLRTDEEDQNMQLLPGGLY